MNELLTAYLYGLYAARRGRLSAADSMRHVLDLMTAARRTRATLEELVGLGARPRVPAPTLDPDAGQGDADA